MISAADKKQKGLEFSGPFLFVPPYGEHNKTEATFLFCVQGGFFVCTSLASKSEKSG